MPSKEVEHSRRCFHANISLGLQSAFSSLRGWLLWLLVAFPRMVFFFILPLTLSNCIHFCTKVTTGWFYLRSNKAWLVDPLNLFQNFIYCCFMVERRYPQLVLPEKYFFRSGDQIRWPNHAKICISAADTFYNASDNLRSWNLGLHSIHLAGGKSDLHPWHLFAPENIGTE